MRILLCALLVGCAVEDDDVDDTDVDETDTVDDTDDDEVEDTDTDVTPTCDGAALCERTLGECGVTTITLDQCLDFYDPTSTTCSDIAAYEACNCDCIEESTCEDYFSCGDLCFADHCGA